MKRLITILLVLSMLMLVSCGGDSEIVPDATDTADSTETTILDGTTAAVDTVDTGSTILDATVEPYYLTDISDSYIVSVKTSYVKTVYHEMITEAVNNCIKSKISFAYYPTEEFELTMVTALSDDFIAKIDNAEYTEFILELEGETVYNGDDFISIIYKGIYSNKTAAYPTHLFFTVNIDSETGDAVKFEDMYMVNEELYHVFAKYAQDKIDSLVGASGAVSVENDLCTVDKFIRGSGINVYFTADNIGISYEVPHALGDHQEVEIPLTEIEQFKK